MNSFTFNSYSQKVLFGNGVLARLDEEVAALGASRTLVLSTPNQAQEAERVVEQLGPRAAGLFAGAVMHVPVETARQAIEAAAQRGADSIVAFGGGSTIGLAKAIALESPLPIIAIPTTYAGSEMTPIYGVTEHGLKRTGRDLKVLPRTVLYDPELTLDLPVQFSITSGINALAHAAEGLYAQDAEPVSTLMAKEAIGALARGLPAIRAAAAGTDRAALLAARSDALYGAWLCGCVLGRVGMALHHKLCHTLGGSFNLPHAEVHTVILPHALAYNAGAAPQAMAAISQAMNAPDAPQAVYDLALANGAPVSLREIGMRAEDVEAACEIAMRNQYPNPRPLEHGAVLQLLKDAFEGRRPGS